MYTDPTGHWRSAKEARDAIELWAPEDWIDADTYSSEWNWLNNLYNRTGNDAYLQQRYLREKLTDDIRAKYSNLITATLPHDNELLNYNDYKEKHSVKKSISSVNANTNLKHEVVERDNGIQIPVPKSVVGALKTLSDLVDAFGGQPISIPMSEIGWGALQTAGGILETSGGILMYGSTLIDGPVGIAGGTYYTINGVSTTTGGISRIVNAIAGNGKGETWNFVRNGCNAFSPQYGEAIYFGTQVPGMIHGGYQLVKSGISLFRSGINKFRSWKEARAALSAGEKINSPTIFKRFLSDGSFVYDFNKLPGREGVIVPNRLTPFQMRFLQQEYGVEFALTYQLGPNKNGGGGIYRLYSGIKDRIWPNYGEDVIQIYHTHPAGYPKYASQDDMDLLGIHSNGTPQRYSKALPLDGPDIIFSKDVNDMTDVEEYVKYIMKSNGYHR